MRIKPTTSYEVMWIYYDINVVNLLHISAICTKVFFSKGILQRHPTLCTNIKCQVFKYIVLKHVKIIDTDRIVRDRFVCAQ